MKTTTLAIAAAMAAGTVAHAQDADCNVNGIPDATEIAQGLADDCNANGIPDSCEYAGVMLEAERSGFGSGSPLIATFTDVDLSLSDVRLKVAVRADLDSVGEFVQVKVGGSVVATLWVTGGQACPSEVQSQTVLIPAATFNASIANGTVVVSLEPSGVVSVKECPSSFASMAAEYVSDVLPADCLGNGAWDGCDISADPSLDCDGNGLIDSCEIDDNPSLDCDGNGVLDACDLAADPLLDCDANGTLDACDIVADPSLDCDSNGQLDSCEIAANPSLDCFGNGVLNSCEIQTGGTYFNYDCDDDGVHDACQIDTTPVLDKNNDRILDSCQYARGDFNLDLSVDSSDLSVLLGMWGTVDPPLGDLNGDGIIDGGDLGLLLIGWGRYEAPWGIVLEFEPDPTVVTNASLRQSLIETNLPWRVRANDSGIELLLVPAGSFLMGCETPPEYPCESSNLPLHEVVLTRPFYLGRYEVTQEQWLSVMGFNPSWFASQPNNMQLPVERVSWTLLQEFEDHTGFRLPTESEWEYACRAGTMSRFNNGGDSIDDMLALGWFGHCDPIGNSEGLTHPVGTKPANALGFHDMHGNVREWCEDWWDSDYYMTSPIEDPPGPSSGIFRVMRGGGWCDSWIVCASATRLGQNPDKQFDEQLGFRVARTP